MVFWICSGPVTQLVLASGSTIVGVTEINKVHTVDPSFDTKAVAVKEMPVI